MEAQRIMTLRVELGSPLSIGRVPGGELTILPITGGTFLGPRLRGRVLAGGADWNTRMPGGISHACARYWIQTDDGAVISVHNEGLLQSDAAPDGFQTTPRFQCDLDGPYAFLTRGLYAGTVQGAGEGAVDIGIWQID